MQNAYFQAVCAFLALQIFAVIGRVYVRMAIVKAFGWDDVAAIVTLFLACGFDCCCLAIYVLARGAVPIQYIRPHYLIDIIYLVLSSELLYIMATGSLKIALGLLLLRVLVKRWMRYTIYMVMAVSTIYALIFFFIVMFQCGSLKAYPRKVVVKQCLSEPAIKGWSYFHAVLQAMADLIYGALPVVYLWNATFTKRAKYSIGGILMLGSVGCISTFVRIGWIHYLVMPTTAFIVTSQGITLFSSIELAIGLICLSLATYKPVWHRIFGRPDTNYTSWYGSHSRITDASWSSHHGVPMESPTTRQDRLEEGLQRPKPIVLGRDTPMYPDHPAKTFRFVTTSPGSERSVSSWWEGRAV